MWWCHSIISFNFMVNKQANSISSCQLILSCLIHYVYTKWKLLTIFQDLLVFMCLHESIWIYVCRSLSLCIHSNQRGYLFPQGWSYRYLSHLLNGCWDLNSRPHDCIAGTNYWAISLIPYFFYFKYHTSYFIYFNWYLK